MQDFGKHFLTKQQDQAQMCYKIIIHVLVI